MQDKLHDEAGRLAALRRYEVLDTPREAPFDRITGLVQAVLNVPIATVSLIDSDRQWYKACLGMDSVDLPRELSFCTHTIQSRDLLIVPDTLLDPRFAQNPMVTGEPFIRSYIGAPLASPDGYNLGSLCALDMRARDFEPTQLEVLKRFAALVVDEMELRRIAQVDSLTEAATRRGFLLEMEKAIAAFKRDGTNATLLLLDLDHFKNINDSFGHPFGDVVLRDVSQAIRGLLRQGDLLGRLGGEEFGVLLGQCDLKRGAAVADVLREKVQHLSFKQEPSVTVTASFGVCSLESERLATELWLARADEALYNAKRAGRNRCFITVSADHLEAFDRELRPTLIKTG